MSKQLVAYTNLVSCNPCKAIHPALEKLAKEYDVVFKHLASDRDDFVAADVRSTPTFVILEDGKEVERLVGVHSSQDLRNALS